MTTAAQPTTTTPPQHDDPSPSPDSPPNGGAGAAAPNGATRPADARRTTPASGGQSATEASVPSAGASVSTASARGAHSARRLPPGPRLPVLVQSALIWNRSVPFLAACRRRYGPVFTLRALPWGHAVVIDEPELVKQVFTGDPAVFYAGEGNSLLAPVLGERSVLVLDEDEHLQTRKRLLPPFHGESVRRYGEVIEQIVAAEIERWPLGQPFPLHPRMRAITLETILQAVIGVSDPVRLRALREVLPATAEVSPLIMAMWVVPGLERVGPWRRYRATVAEANRVLRIEISERRRDPNLAERQDVLSQLVRAGEIDDDDLRDQIITLLMAGHETTTTGLAWAFERLLRNPDVLARARAGDDAYLDAVVQETLRIRPVIPAVLRSLQAPVELRRVHAAGRRDCDAGDHADALRSDAVSRTRALQARALPGGRRGLDLHLDPVRRRAAALPGRGLRELRDARHAAHDPAAHAAARRPCPSRESARSSHHAGARAGRPCGQGGVRWKISRKDSASLQTELGAWPSRQTGLGA